jgi:hypothetical protein
MEIKFELDTEKMAKVTVAIAASHGLEQVSEGSKYPQLAFANAPLSHIPRSELILLGCTRQELGRLSHQTPP